MIYVNEKREIDKNEWKHIFELLNVYEKLKSSKSISIKPNFASGQTADPKRHIVTDLKLLSSLINFILDINNECIIYISESDSTGNGFAYLKFENLKLPSSLKLNKDKTEKIRLLDMSRDKLIQIKNDTFRYFNNENRKFWISQTFYNSDIKISLSNLKTHSITGYSASCKNLFGCLPDFDKSKYHTYIHKVIHDINVVINPEICIIDGFYGMERNGPIHGLDIDSGYRVVSNDSLESDIYASYKIGYNPKKIKYINLLNKTYGKKIDNINDDKVKRVKYKRPKIFLRVMNNIGIFVQKFGQKISNFGHNIHAVSNIISLFVTIFRPILIKIFGKERLKRIRAKFIHENE